MRYLHPVQMHEKFVASGVYSIQTDTLPARTEQWSIHELPDGSWFIRADCELASQPHDDLLLEALVQTPLTAPKIERVDLRYLANQPGSKTSRTQTLIFFEDYIQVGYTQDNQPREQIELRLTPGYIPAPDFAYILTGFYTRAAVVQGFQQTTVFRRYVSPEIALNTAQLTVNTLEAEQLTVAGKPVSTHTYTLAFAEDSDTQNAEKVSPTGRKVWLAQNNVLVREEGARHGVNLAQYAQRIEPSKK